MSSLQQNWRKEQNRFCLKVREGEGSGGGQTMYGHMNKLIKKPKKKPI
jgi:hypothetical protein